MTIVVKRRISAAIPAVWFVVPLLCMLIANVHAGVGEAAVITLSFPPGARATGIGEAFTGLGDDATATYYNPAGLGLSPMANSWKVHLSDKQYVFTAIAAIKKKDFSTKSAVWAGTNKGLLRYNGKLWEKNDFYLIEQNDNLESIVEKFIDIESENRTLIKDAAWIIRVENGIGMKRFESIKSVIRGELKKKHAEVSSDSIATNFSRQLIEMPPEERSSTKIYAILSQVVDSNTIGILSKTIESIFTEDDKEFEDFTELKIPFSIAVSDSVTALAIDNSDRLWVGTSNGIWRLNEHKWSFYSILDGLPSNKITALAAGPYGELVAGTNNGVALYVNGEWSIKSDSTSALPSNEINAVAFGQNSIIFAGTDSGLVKIDNKTISFFDTSDGLFTQKVTALFMDSNNKLWIGGPNGITIFNNVSWKRYQFPKSKITSFVEQNEKTVWIGTDKGAISYTTGKTVTDERGNVTENPPEWKPYHSKNALIGDNITGLTVQNKDVWLITENGINQYDIAERQTTVAFEMLLPELKINDLWHLYWTLIWPTENWGTIGGSINYINMGENTFNDALGREIKTVRSWEGVFGLSYGLTISENFALGLNAKYVVSALAPGLDDGGIGYTFAIDASLLKRNLFSDKFDLGFMFQNMGPHIFYIDEQNKDPIPFTLRLGTAYHIFENPIHDLKFVFDMHKEIVKNNYGEGDPDNFLKALWTDLVNDTSENWKYELQEINYNFGFEYWYTAFFALRTGFLFDYLGERYEWTSGVGIRYGTLNFDWSYIYAPEGFLKGFLSSISEGKDGATGVRDGQWRASFIFVF